MTTRYYLKPILHQAGNKTWFKEDAWKYYRKASEQRGEFLRWVDPFCGSLAIPFFILPESAWINDASVHFINFYNEVIKNPVFPKITADEEVYYATREKFNQLIQEESVKGREAAETFYLLNRLAYGNLVRFSKSGKFNSPFSKKKIFDEVENNFEDAAEILKEWKITNFDYSRVIEESTETDFIFADPPYDDQFNNYLKGGFPWEEQEKLANLLAAHPGPVLTTNNPTDRIVELYTSLGFERSDKTRFNYLKAPKIGSNLKFKEVIFTRNINE
jgi:DNA adenine methylase